MILLGACTGPAYGKPSNAHRPLGNGVYSAIRAFERTHEEGPTLKALCISNTRHHTIYPLPRLHKCGKVGRHHDSGRILDLYLIGIYIDTHAFHHVRNGLQGEFRLCPVTRAIQPHNQAITHQLIDPNTLNLGYVLDTGASPTVRCGQGKEYARYAKDHAKPHG